MIDPKAAGAIPRHAAHATEGPMTSDELRENALGGAAVEDGTSWACPRSRSAAACPRACARTATASSCRASALISARTWIETEPDVCYVTAHYAGWPTVLPRLSRADPVAVVALLRRHWRELAPKRDVAAFDASRD